MVSLTLVPMLASRFLRHHKPQEENALGRLFERGFDAMQRGYAKSLDWALAHRVFIGGVAIGSVVLTGVLFVTIPKGFFPEEDIGQISVTTEAAEDISFGCDGVAAQPRGRRHSQPTRRSRRWAPAWATPASAPRRRTPAACSSR